MDCKRFLLLFFSILLYSCANPKHGVIEDYKLCLNLSNQNQYDGLTLLLNPASQSFVNKITNDSLQSYQSYYKLGKDNNILFFATEYAAKVLNDQNGQGRIELFYQLISELDISFFSYDKKYQVSEEKSRVGTDPHVAIYYEEKAQKKMSWVKMETQQEGYKLDLLYLLSLYDSSQEAKFKEDLKYLDQKALMDYHYTGFLRKLNFIHDVDFHKNGEYNRKALYK